MTTIRHELEARCRPERVWALLADLTAVQQYNPTVRRAEIDGEKRSGVGARRVCELAPQGRVVERVTHWEDSKAIGLEVVESDWPIRSMQWITRVEPSGAGSRITQDLTYAPKFGPLGWLLDRLVMERKLRATLDDVLARLVQRAEAP